MTSLTGSKRKASNRLAGMTLIEVLISVILLAGGAVLVMQSFATGWQVIVRADERSTAYLFALSKLADLELSHAQGRAVDRKSGTFRSNNKPYTWQLELPASEDPELSLLPKRVTLSVNWPRGKFQDESQFSLLLPAAAAKKQGT